MAAVYGLLDLAEQLLKVSHGDGKIEAYSKDEYG